MTTLHVHIETEAQAAAAVIAAMKNAQAGLEAVPADVVSFASYDDMHAVLSPSRLAIIRALTGQGPLSIREVARRVGRDVQAVHRDVTRLLNAGIIDRTDQGIRFDYDGIDFSFQINTAA